MQENAWGVSPFTLNFIKKLEGYTPKPKWDYKQHSVGYGTRWEPGMPVGTQADHEAALGREAGKVKSWLDQNVKTPLTDNQRAALVSAGFNLGTGEKGIGRLLGDINSGNWDSVARRLPTFNKAGGEVNKGLINRRAAEVEMLTGRKPTLQDAMGSTGYIGGTGAAPSPGPAAMPVDQLVAPSGRYSKLADALMAQAASARPTGWGTALQALGSAALGHSLASKEDNAEKEYRSKLAQALGGATDTNLAQTLIASGDPDLIKSGVSLKVAKNKPEIGRFKVEDGAVIDTTTGQVISGKLRPKETADDTLTVNGRVIKRNPDGQGYSEIYTAPPKLEATDRKEIFEADDGIRAGTNVIGSLDRALELNDKAYSGPGAQTRGYITSLVGSEGGTATEELQNVVTSQVLENLKATFGGMPTEGERQILLEVQGSVNKSPEVRRRIYESARKAAERRIEFNKQKAEALRGGQYFQPGYSPAQGATPEAAPPAAAAPAAAPKQYRETPQAQQALISDPSPEKMRLYDELFGPGAAQRAISSQQQQTPSSMGIIAP